MEGHSKQMGRSGSWGSSWGISWGLSWGRSSGIVTLYTVVAAIVNLGWAGSVEAQGHVHAVHGGQASTSMMASAPSAPIVAAPHQDPLTYGEGIPVGRGIARTYVVRRQDGSTELGVALSEGVMDGLPGAGDPGAIIFPDGLSMFEFELPLPAGNPTPYRHVVLNWNPGGHEPPGVYDLAHFDFHFYLIDGAARRAIDLDAPGSWERAARHPDPSLVPSGYFPPDGATVSGMGVHWLDPASPELNGEIFSRTFLFGSWDGELVFSEPMITKAFLEEKSNLTFRLPVAERPLASGPLPESYSTRWDPEAREHRVGIDLPASDASSAGTGR